MSIFFRFWPKMTLLMRTGGVTKIILCADHFYNKIIACFYAILRIYAPSLEGSRDAFRHELLVFQSSKLAEKASIHSSKVSRNAPKVSQKFAWQPFFLQKARAETRTGHAGQKCTSTQKTNRKVKVKRTNEKKRAKVKGEKYIKICKRSALENVKKGGAWVSCFSQGVPRSDPFWQGAWVRAQLWNATAAIFLLENRWYPDFGCWKLTKIVHAPNKKRKVHHHSASKDPTKTNQKCIKAPDWNSTLDALRTQKDVFETRSLMHFFQKWTFTRNHFL